ncbi:MAG: hypothetical protein ACLTE4_07535 [Christensenellaceae bacterium]
MGDTEDDVKIRTMRYMGDTEYSVKIRTMRYMGDTESGTNAISGFYASK